MKRWSGIWQGFRSEPDIGRGHCRWIQTVNPLVLASCCGFIPSAGFVLFFVSEFMDMIF